MQACLDVERRRSGVRRRRGDELEVTTPRVEVGRVRVIVDGRVGGAVIVEDELVGREERIAVAAADTLGSRTAATHTHTHVGQITFRRVVRDAIWTFLIHSR